MNDSTKWEERRNLAAEHDAQILAIFFYYHETDCLGSTDLCLRLIDLVLLVSIFYV